MAVLLNDTFTRADSTTTPGTPESGGPYSVVTGTWGINTNKLYTAVSTANSVLTAPGAYNLRMTANVSGTSLVSEGIIFRYKDASNYWLLCISTSTGNAGLYRNIAGSFSSYSNLVAVTTPVALKVEAVGRYIWAYINGRLVATVPDQLSTSADTSVGVWVSSNTAARIDDLYAEDLATLVAPTDLALYKGRDLATDDAGATA